MVYVGSKTGRDGIHGATMASAEFSEDSEEKRPTVQVGDPFTEKLLIEACLELMATDAIVAIQDMGAAGLTSSSVEMAGKGGLGIELDLDQVPLREDRHDRLRDHALRKPGAHADGPEARPRGRRRGAIFEKWELDFAVIGHVTDTGRLVLRMARRGRRRHAARAAGHRGAALRPALDRDAARAPELRRDGRAGADDSLDALMTLIGCPDLASKRWIWEQYDHLVMGDTVQRPGGDAAVVRVPAQRKALALTTDCTPRYVPGRSRARRQAGGGRELAQPHRRRRACRSPSPTT